MVSKSPRAFDTDTHITEEAGTWDAIDPQFAGERLQIVTDAEEYRWLMRGESRLLLIRALVDGELDAMRILTRDDPFAYERLMEQRRALPAPGPRFDSRLNDLDARVEIMDEMNVSHSVIYPSLALWWPTVINDLAAVDAHYAAWNTWISAQTRSLRDRLLPVAQTSFHDPERAVAEIRRCSELGFRGLFVRAIPYRELPWEHESYEPIWDALEAADMPLLLHFTVVQTTAIDVAWEKQLEPRHTGFPIQMFHNRALPAEAALTSLIMGGVLERHPRLRVGVIEFGSCWVPSFLHRLEFTFDFVAPRNRYLRERLPLRPSEYFRRQVKVSTIWNEPLEWLIRSAGESVFMFASDFPHPEGNAKAFDLAQSNLGTLPEETRRRFFSDNARELFAI